MRGKGQGWKGEVKRGSYREDTGTACRRVDNKRLEDRLGLVILSPW